jgi:hypothetical protein
MRWLVVRMKSVAPGVNVRANPRVTSAVSNWLLRTGVRYMKSTAQPIVVRTAAASDPSDGRATPGKCA